MIILCMGLLMLSAGNLRAGEKSQPTSEKSQPTSEKSRPASSISQPISQEPLQTVPAYIDAQGDTIPTILLRPFVKYGPETVMTAKQEKYYWRLVRDVRKCLPLAKLAANTMIETTEYIRTLPTQEEREKHLRKMERDLIKEYEPVLRKMSYSQGKVLLKLIVRECNSTPYEILQAYLGNFAADFWQTVARLFTADLKMDYNPDGKDALIEKIATKIEQGEL